MARRNDESVNFGNQSGISDTIQGKEGDRVSGQERRGRASDKLGDHVKIPEPFNAPPVKIEAGENFFSRFAKFYEREGSLPHDYYY